MKWFWWRNPCCGHAPRLFAGDCGCPPDPDFFLRGSRPGRRGWWRPVGYVWAKGGKRGWFVRVRLP